MRHKLKEEWSSCWEIVGMSRPQREIGPARVRIGIPKAFFGASRARPLEYDSATRR
jgi:hypothetical protein